MVKHTRQNQFHGSIGRHAPPKGGQQTVTERQVIGTFDCWCQGDICTINSTGQWWPGKEQGFRHPREKDDVSTEILERVDRSDVKLFGKSIQDLLMTLVNECDIRYRMIDGKVSMLLYPPDGESRPFKISSARPAKQQLGYLHTKFINIYDIELPKKEKPEVGEPTVTFTAPAPDATPAPPESPFVQPSAVMVEEEQPEASSAAEPTEEWVPYLGSRSQQDTEFDTNGTLFRCRQCFAEGRTVTFDKPTSLAGHKATNHSDRAPYSEEAIAKRSKTFKENRRRETMEGHLRRMANLMEIDWPSGVEVRKMQSRIEGLEAKVESLTVERDEALEAATNPETGGEALIAERDLALARAERAESRLATLRSALNGDD